MKGYFSLDRDFMMLCLFYCFLIYSADVFRVSDVANGFFTRCFIRKVFALKHPTYSCQN